MYENDSMYFLLLKIEMAEVASYLSLFVPLENVSFAVFFFNVVHNPGEGFLCPQEEFLGGPFEGASPCWL